MADVAVQHSVAAAYEPSLFRHLLQENRDVAVPTLRFAYLWSSVIRLQLWANLNPKLADSVSLWQHHQRDFYDRVPSDQFVDHGAGGTRVGLRKDKSGALVAIGDHGLRHGICHFARPRVEPSNHGRSNPPRVSCGSGGRNQQGISRR